MAEKIVKGMSDKGTRKIAIIDFSDLDARVTALGQFMAEELTAQLFLVAPGKFEVVERRQLLKLEEELALGQAGVIEEKSLKKMGQVLGVEAVVTGSMTDLGNTIKVNARMIAVESAKVFAVAATSIPKTGIVADLASKAVERRPGGSAPAAAAPAAPASKPTRVQAAMSVEVNNFLFALQGCKKGGDRIAVIVVVRERVMNRRESQMGVVLQKLFWSLPVQQARDHDRSHSDARARETGTASADLGIADDMGVGACRHGASASDFHPHRNLSGRRAAGQRGLTGDRERQTACQPGGGGMAKSALLLNTT